MKKQKLTIMFLAILVCSLSLMGCKDAEEEKALAEAAQAKAKLAKTESERDAIKAELATVIEARDELQKQLFSKLTKDATKDKETQARIGKLMGQLKEQTEKAIGLQEQNKKLQETIDSL